MHFRFLSAAAALLLLTLFLFFGVAELRESERPEEPVGTAPGTSVKADRVEAASNKGRSAVVRDVPEAPRDSTGLLQAEQQIRDLEQTLSLATKRVRAAQESLAESEVEVTELEQMIAEIKARGEDPADYGDLALERFQPAFFRFQDAQAAYDNAQRLKADAESALRTARAELARRRAGGGTGTP